MEQHIKQRLVGVAVIFLLAIIFLPMLLDGSGYRREQLDIEIPPPPVIDSRVKVEEKVIELKQEVADLPEVEPFIVDEVSSPPSVGVSGSEGPDLSLTPENEQVSASVSQSGNAPAPTTAESQASAPEEPKPLPEARAIDEAKPKPKVGGETWVIQLGSFSDKDKAYALRDRLRKSNLAAVFIENFDYQGSTRYRVRMGPFLSRDKGDVINNKLLAKYNIKGLVMHYEK